MKYYSVQFALYGGLRAVPVQADNKKEAIEKAKKQNGCLPAHFIKCVECK